jgi:pre-mRNA-processing factor 6
MAIWAEPRPTRKSRSADALRKAADDPLIICTVARLFWAERKIEKARQWFERAVKVNPDLGDVWGWWLKFEQQHGTAVCGSFVLCNQYGRSFTFYAQEYQAEVVRRCVAAEPHHGRIWQSIAKDMQNIGKSTKEVLDLVAAALH